MKRAMVIAGLAALWAGVASPAAQAEDTPPKPDNEQAVTLSPVALPIVVDGRLANYIFVTVKVLLTPSADVFTLRDKEPYFRDALVRAGHRTPFTLANDYNHVDEAKLDATLFNAAQAITGPGKVLRVQVISQTPQHRLSAPH